MVLVVQCLANVSAHIVFSTKERRPFLRDDDLRDSLHREIGGSSQSMNCPPIITGGVEDHVHFLARMSRTISLADGIKELRRVTSTRIKQQPRGSSDFSWQAGSATFSVRQSNIPEVIRYIRNQVEHHRNTNFKSEFRRMLEPHEIECDEQYV